eukprot:1239318-Rhodomonas_salina.1
MVCGKRGGVMEGGVWSRGFLCRKFEACEVGAQDAKLPCRSIATMMVAHDSGPVSGSSARWTHGFRSTASLLLCLIPQRGVCFQGRRPDDQGPQ